MEDKNNGWDSLEFSEIVDKENTISPTESESSCHSTESSPAISAILKLRPIIHKRKGVPSRSPFFWNLLSQSFLKYCNEYLLVFFYYYLSELCHAIFNLIKLGSEKIMKFVLKEGKRVRCIAYKLQYLSSFFFFFLLFALFQLEKSYQDNFILYFLLF